MSQREIAGLTGVSNGAVCKILKGGSAPELKSGKDRSSRRAKNEQEMTVRGDTASFYGETTSPIRSEADALREFQIDPAVWYVDLMTVKAWTVTVQEKANGAAKAKRIQNYGVTLKLKRILPYAFQRASEALFERLGRSAPRFKAPKLPRRRGCETFLAVMCLFDAHFGKLCWKPETRNDYDLKIAESTYRNAVDDLLAESASRPIERWLYPIGNDFFHMDNRKNMTTAGTPQDVDGRYEKIIVAGEAAVLWAVERMAEIAPVSVVHVPGNHDRTASWHLARTVETYFRHHPAVEVDRGPSPRKYYTWEITLLGLTHGDEEKMNILPSLMSVERPTDWAATTCREWLCGHDHRTRQWQTKGADTYEGVTVRKLRSLSGTDAWHHGKGYVGVRAAEVYFYGKTRGYAGHAVVNARE